MLLIAMQNTCLDYSSLSNELLAVAQLLYTGEIGAANSRYAQALAPLISALDAIMPIQKRDAMREMSKIMNQQKQEDWVGMADSLQYGLAVLFDRVV